MRQQQQRLRRRPVAELDAGVKSEAGVAAGAAAVSVVDDD